MKISTSGFNFLGIGTGTDFKPGENYTTALYLHAIGGEHMPQYMLGVATGTVEDESGVINTDTILLVQVNILNRLIIKDICMDVSWLI